MKSVCSALVLCQESLFLCQEIWLCFSGLGSALPPLPCCMHPRGTEGRLLLVSSLPSVLFALLALPVEVVLWRLLNVRVQPHAGKKNHVGSAGVCGRGSPLPGPCPRQAWSLLACSSRSW